MWMYVSILLMLLVAYQAVFGHLNKRQLLVMIDRLTDKLMARDYSEYKRYDNSAPVKVEEDKEQLSYFDQ